MNHKHDLLATASKLLAMTSNLLTMASGTVRPVLRTVDATRCEKSFYLVDLPGTGDAEGSQ